MLWPGITQWQSWWNSSMLEKPLHILLPKIFLGCLQLLWKLIAASVYPLARHPLHCHVNKNENITSKNKTSHPPKQVHWSPRLHKKEKGRTYIFCKTFIFFLFIFLFFLYEALFKRCRGLKLGGNHNFSATAKNLNNFILAYFFFNQCYITLYRLSHFRCLLTFSPFHYAKSSIYKRLRSGRLIGGIRIYYSTQINITSVIFSKLIFLWKILHFI